MSNEVQDARLTPLSDWLNDYEVVALPSGKKIGMRPVNVMTLMNREGKIPSFIAAKIEEGTGRRKEAPAPSAEDNMDMQRLGDQILRAGLVFPPLVETEDDERAGKGVTLLRFSINDKYAVIGWALGGAAYVEAAQRFPQQQAANIQSIPASEDLQREAVGNSGD